MAPWASVSLAWMLVTVGRLPAQGSLVGAGGADSFQLLPPPPSLLYSWDSECATWERGPVPTVELRNLTFPGTPAF